MLNDLLGVVVVNLGAFLVVRLLTLRSPGSPGRGFLGYYLVLMPVGFAAWWYPHLLVNAAVVLVGLLLITRSARKAMAAPTGDAPGIRGGA